MGRRNLSEAEREQIKALRAVEREAAKAAFRDSVDYDLVQDAKRHDREIAKAAFRDSADYDLVQDAKRREREIAKAMASGT